MYKIYYNKEISKEIITFGYTETENRKFHRYKNPNFLEDPNDDNILISNKISFGEKHYKYFTGYMDDGYKIKPLHIMLPKTRAYLKSYDGETK